MNDKLAWNNNVVFVIEILPEKEKIRIDNLARNNKICFIYAVKSGLCSFVFIDFTRSLSYNMNITLKRDNFIWKISKKSKEGLAEIQWNGVRNPYVQEYILFKEVDEITEMNYELKNINIHKR